VYDKKLQLISESKVPSGYGIRHLVFSKDGKYIYAVNELVPSISVFAYQNGQSKLINTVKIHCENLKANGAGIRLSKDGKYLYISLREENSLCVFLVEDEKITLLQKEDCGGDSPRDFDIISDNIIVCNEKSGDVVAYKMANGLIKEKITQEKTQGGTPMSDYHPSVDPLSKTLAWGYTTLL
jgi:6-phosphogluconolactonase